MPRIAGIDIPNNKRILISLTYIHGIGLSTSKKVLNDLSIDENTRTKELDEQQIGNIRKYIEDSRDILTEGELRRIVSQNIKRKKDIRSYQGIRHARRLPVRGQKTQSNARTKRGKRVPVGGANPRAASKT